MMATDYDAAVINTMNKAYRRGEGPTPYDANEIVDIRPYDELMQQVRNLMDEVRQLRGQLQKQSDVRAKEDGQQAEQMSALTGEIRKLLDQGRGSYR